MELDINKDSCIVCGHCVAVCPSHIFSIKEKSIALNYTELCISCGHCVASCPTLSVVHSEFPSDKVHKIDYTQMPSAEQVMLLCKVRRSNRAFSKKPVPKELLYKILEAAHVAPTASNMQQVAFTVVTDPEKLNFIIDYTIKVFSGVVNKLTNPILRPLLKMMMPAVYKYLPAFNRLINERAKGVDFILRGATAVILIHTPEKNRFGCQDANLAYQNGSLMAEALGVSQFYTGFVCSAVKQDKSKELAKKLGIKGTIHAGMALGIPSFKFDSYTDRKEIIADFL